MIEIALCTDLNYLIPTGVLIHSIEKTNHSIDIHYNIISEKLDETNQKNLRDCISNSKSSISFFFVDKELLNECPIREKDYITLAAYYRILFPLILPKSISKLLYLDGDMICTDSLENLWNEDITNHSLGAVIDIYSSDIRRKNRLSLGTNAEYFNSGMLLINLEWWRNKNIHTKTLEYIANNKEILLAHDQDALNKVLEGTVKYLHPKYNLLLDFWKETKELFIDKKHFKLIEQAKESPTIIHFSGAEKPWHKECVYPLKKIWDYFLMDTKWKNLKKINKYSGKRLIKNKLRSFLETINFLDSKNPYKNIETKEIEKKIINRIENM